ISPRHLWNKNLFLPVEPMTEILANFDVVDMYDGTTNGWAQMQLSVPRTS
ncbi:MAG: hypothetical protein IPJ66_20480, partial [Bacteroidetes bacterium]|nr:hypothetical protein [Bacteroidota bacterium]